MSRPVAGAGLKDVKVIDLTQVVSGAVTTMLMADFGADVVKIEPPQGEPYRSSGHTIRSEEGETNLNILRFSRGKRSVTLNLKSPEGRRVFDRLIATGDVLVENFRGGVLAKLGYDTERLRELNPGLIYTSISGFGSNDIFPSDDGDPPTYAITAEAAAGLMHLAGRGEGDPPQWMGFAMTDIFAGALAFSGTLMALRDRESTGIGRRVDIGMFDAALFMNDLPIAMYSVLGEIAGPGQYALQAPWGPYRTSDGFVVIAALTARQWSALCEVIGRTELAHDDRLATGRDRSRRHDDLVRPAIEAWSRTLTKEEASAQLLARDVPSAPVNTAAEAVAQPRVGERDMLIEVEEPIVGRQRLVGNPIKLDGLPRRDTPPRVPQLGEHTNDVLTDLGCTSDDIKELRRVGAL